MLQQVSDFELELMKIIWENGGTALYAEIVEKLDSKGMSTTKNTIISLLLRLIEKGFLKTNKIGRRNRYTRRSTRHPRQKHFSIRSMRETQKG